MKKYFLLFIFLGFLISSCGEKNGEGYTGDELTDASGDVSSSSYLYFEENYKCTNQETGQEVSSYKSKIVFQNNIYSLYSDSCSNNFIQRVYSEELENKTYNNETELKSFQFEGNLFTKVP